MTLRRSPFALAAVCIAALPALGFVRPAAPLRRFAVAADNADASRAGAAVLRAGGNAVDAAIATALALGVASPSSSGFGGGGFATICTPEGQCTFVDFREVAPAALTPDLLAHAPDPARASHVGALAVAVPGEPSGFVYMARRWGRLPLARSVAPAAALARNGFAVTDWVSQRVLNARADLERDAWLRGMWLPLGEPVRAGVRLRRPRLGATLERYGREGDGFVRGAFAQAVGEAVRAGGGVLTAQDVAAYTPVERAVLSRPFREYTVATAPYPSAGGLILLQTLAMVERAPRAWLASGSSAYLHLLSESWRRSFDDRARYVGDPANPGVVSADALLDRARMDRRRASIDPAHASAVVADEPRDHGTTHLCVIDARGMTVALTTTVNENFGARIAVPSLDVILNDEIDDYSLGAGSSYGLAASRPNAMIPGRRPVSSMSPTVVLRDGHPIGCVGAGGGPRIPTSTAQVLLAMTLHGMDPEAALAQPRAHHQGTPDQLGVEREVPEDVRAGLTQRGHRVVEMPSPPSTTAVAQAIWTRTVDGVRELLAASDPRKGGAPAGE